MCASGTWSGLKVVLLDSILDFLKISQILIVFYSGTKQVVSARLLGVRYVSTFYAIMTMAFKLA